MRRRILVLALALVVGGCAALPPVPARADVGNVGNSWTVTGTGALPWLPLSGQNNCTVSVTGSPSGLVAVPQVATDYGPNYQSIVTASTIGSGSISAAGVYNGSVATQQPSAIRVNVTGYSSGATQLSIVCGPGGGTGGGGGGGTSSGPPAGTAINLLGTWNSTTGNLSGTDANGSTKCVLNAGSSNSCTITLTGPAYFLGWTNQNGSAITGDLRCDDSSTAGGISNSTQLFDTSTTNLIQAGTNAPVPPSGGALLKSNHVTCQLQTQGTTGAKGVTIWVNPAP